jgi:hypothetical protein
MTASVASLCPQSQQVPCKSSTASSADQISVIDAAAERYTSIRLSIQSIVGFLVNLERRSRCAATGDSRVPTVSAQITSVRIRLGTSPRKGDNAFLFQKYSKYTHKTRPSFFFFPSLKSLSERKIDDIAQKLAELGNALGAGQNSTQHVVPAATSSKIPSHPTSTACLAPIAQATSPSPNHGVGSQLLTPRLEHQGESSLSAQAAFANEFLEDAIINKPNGIDIAAEMSSVLQSLRQALGRNSNQQEHDYLYPHARALESGHDLRNLPMPPVDKAFICLRMSKGISRAFGILFPCSMLTVL